MIPLTSSFVANREGDGRDKAIDSVAGGQQADVRVAYACGEYLDEHFIRPGRGNRDPLGHWIGL